MSTSPQATVQVDFTLAVGTGHLDASLSVPPGDVTITELLPALQTLSSNIIGSALQIIADEGYTISCRAGCGACCRQLVPLSIFEAEAIAEWIRSLPIDEQHQLEARFHHALAALSSSGILDRLNPTADRTADEDKQLAIDYMAQTIACPFLVDESCSIHPIRPLICREYLVTSPAAFCSSPSEYPVEGVHLPLKLSRVLFRLGAQLEHNPGGWIPLVFLFAWMRGGSRPGDAVHGPGPELLYEVVKRLTPA